MPLRTALCCCGYRDDARVTIRRLDADGRFDLSMAIACVIAGSAAIPSIVLGSGPTSMERFEACMSMADRAGLRERRREDAGLICLQNATARPGRVPAPAIPAGTGMLLGIP